MKNHIAAYRKIGEEYVSLAMTNKQIRHQLRDYIHEQDQKLQESISSQDWDDVIDRGTKLRLANQALRNAGLSSVSQVYTGPLKVQKQILPFFLFIANFSLIDTAVLGTWGITFCSIFPPDYVANYFTPFFVYNQIKSSFLWPLEKIGICCYLEFFFIF